MKANRGRATAILAAALIATGKAPWLDFKAAARRAIGTKSTDWRHDPERVAAAEAKRQRRMARNRRNAR